MLLLPYKRVVLKKIDGQREFGGRVSEISETDFVLMHSKTGTTKKLVYEDVQRVNQKGVPKGAKVAIVVGGIIGVFLLVWAAKGWFLFNLS